MASHDVDNGALNVLLIDDSPTDADLIREYLDASGEIDRFTVKHCKTLSTALSALGEANAFDIILTDLGLPDFDGLEGVARIIEAAPNVPVLVLTGNRDRRLGVEAMRAGAQDYLIKDMIRGPELSTAIRHALIRQAHSGALRHQIEERQWAERRLRLLLDTSESIAAAPDVDVALREVLSHLCVGLGWVYGEVWALKSDGRTMAFQQAYTRGAPALERFAAASMEYAFEHSDNLTRHASDSGEIIWVNDVTAPSEVAFLRDQEAREAGLKAALAVPISVNGSVIAVFRLYADQAMERDEEFVDLVRSLADQFDQTLMRKQAEVEARHAQRQFRDFATYSADWFWETDMEQRFTYLSGQYAQAFGGSQDDVIGHKRSDLGGITESDEPYAEVIGRFMGACEVFENLVVHFTSESRLDGWVELSGGPIRDETGTVVGYRGTARNITDRKLTEEHLRHAQKMDAIGNLTGGVAHDFNNLLTVVLGNLELLSEFIPEGEERALLDDAIRAGERGTALIRKLLTFARRQPLETQVADVNELVSGMARILERTLGEKIAIQLRLGDEIPHVRVDPVQFETALANLAVNARDAMPHGGKLTVETSFRELDEVYAARHTEVEAGRYVCVDVTDTGMGMPSEVRDRVFEPFFTTKEEGRGTGLGLPMIFGFVKQLEGHVSVYSEEGHGTMVRLYLPCTEASSETAREVEQSDEPIGGSERLLVVEDDPDVRAVTMRQIRRLGYDVCTADSGVEALRILERDNNIDLVLSDVVMPGGMTGIVLAEEVRSRWPQVPVVLASGYSTAVLEQETAATGMHLDVLNKPYRREELTQKLREVFARKTD